jgi:hypothetical protein
MSDLANDTKNHTTKSSETIPLRDIRGYVKSVPDDRQFLLSHPIEKYKI